MAISDKLTYLNTTKTKIREGLNFLGADLDTEDTFRSYVDAINGIYEDYPKITGEGIDLSLDNTKQASMKIDYKGNTSQNGTPTPSSPIPVNVVSGDNEINICGKNLFDGQLELGGYGGTGAKVDANNNYRNANTISVKPSTTYTFSINGVSQKYVILFYDINGNFISQNTSLTTGTFTTLNNAYFINFRTFNADFVSDFSNLKVQLEKGPQATSFEPYIGNTYHIYLGVENLKNSNNIISGYFDTSTTTISTSPANKTIYCNVEPNTTYYVSKLRGVRSFVGTTTTLPAIGVSVSNIKNIGTSGYDGTTVVSGTITTGANDKFLVFNYVNTNSESGDIETSIYNSLIIIKGNKLQYISNNPIELCWIPNTTYQDIIFKAVNGDEYYDSLTQAKKDLLTYGKWYLHKEVGKTIFNGSETGWTKYGAYGATYLYYIDNATDGYTTSTGTLNFGIGLSNYFVWIDDGIGHDYAYTRFQAGNGKRIYFAYTSDLSLDNWKTWLGTHNTTVYYVLATPTDTEITDSTLLEQLEESKLSYASQTNISQVNNDLPFNLDVKALRGE